MASKTETREGSKGHSRQPGRTTPQAQLFLEMQTVCPTGTVEKLDCLQGTADLKEHWISEFHAICWHL